MPHNSSPSSRRSLASKQLARSLWHVAPGTAEIQIETLSPPQDGYARIKTLYSGISRGTERLIANGAVPQSEWQTMRAPFQTGEFPFPVKYGYSAAGQVVEGPNELLNAHVFCLYPHQDQFVAPIDSLVLIPDNIPPRRATLAANMETALNANWDAGTAPGDNIVIIGGGIVGLLTAHLAARIPGTTVTLIDTNLERRSIAQVLGFGFASPENMPENADVVFHTSASGPGLQTAIACAGTEATVIEMSWYGDAPISVQFGGAMHSRRLLLLSSQVGRVSPSHRARWNFRRRLAKAVELLDEPALDQLVADEIAFDEAPEKLPIVFDKDYLKLPPVIAYPGPSD